MNQGGAPDAMDGPSSASEVAVFQEPSIRHSFFQAVPMPGHGKLSAFGHAQPPASEKTEIQSNPPQPNNAPRLAAAPAENVTRALPQIAVSSSGEPAGQFAPVFEEWDLKKYFGSVDPRASFLAGMMPHPAMTQEEIMNEHSRMSLISRNSFAPSDDGLDTPGIEAMAVDAPERPADAGLEESMPPAALDDPLPAVAHSVAPPVAGMSVQNAKMPQPLAESPEAKAPSSQKMLSDKLEHDMEQMQNELTSHALSLPPPFAPVDPAATVGTLALQPAHSVQVPPPAAFSEMRPTGPSAAPPAVHYPMMHEGPADAREQSFRDSVMPTGRTAFSMIMDANGNNLLAMNRPYNAASAPVGQPGVPPANAGVALMQSQLYPQLPVASQRAPLESPAGGDRAATDDSFLRAGAVAPAAVAGAAAPAALQPSQLANPQQSASIIMSCFLQKLNRHGGFQKRLFRCDGTSLMCFSATMFDLPDGHNIVSTETRDILKILHDYVDRQTKLAIGKCYLRDLTMARYVFNPMLSECSTKSHANPNIRGLQLHVPKYVIPLASMRAIVYAEPKARGKNRYVMTVQTSRHSYSIRAPSRAWFLRLAFVLGRVARLVGAVIKNDPGLVNYQLDHFPIVPLQSSDTSAAVRQALQQCWKQTMELLIEVDGDVKTSIVTIKSVRPAVSVTGPPSTFSGSASGGSSGASSSAPTAERPSGSSDRVAS